MVLPAGVLEAYRDGRMTARDRRELEADVRNGLVSLPPGEALSTTPQQSRLASEMAKAAAFSLLPALALLAIQYVTVGFLNPRRLFSVNRASRRDELAP